MEQDQREGPDDIGADEEPLRVYLQDRGVNDYLWHINCVQFIRSWLKEETATFGGASYYRGDQEAIPTLEEIHPNWCEWKYYGRYWLFATRHQVPNRLICIFTIDLFVWIVFCEVVVFFIWILKEKGG